MSCSKSDKLRDVIEVGIAGIQRQIMLEDEAGDPNIVGGYWGGLLAELLKETSVVMRGLLVGVEHSDPGRIEKPSQYLLVPSGPAPAKESGAQFSQGDKGKIDALGLLNP